MGTHGHIVNPSPSTKETHPQEVETPKDKSKADKNVSDEDDGSVNISGSESEYEVESKSSQREASKAYQDKLQILVSSKNQQIANLKEKLEISDRQRRYKTIKLLWRDRFH